jgi:YesN/AraC family two-component response regulator
LTRLIIHDLQATLNVARASHQHLQPSTLNLQPSSSHRQQLVQRMLDYIHEHYSRPMQLGDVAAVLNMNVAYISSLFHATTGVTFHHYLEELRLAKAKELLRDPLKRIGEVAYAVGYANPNYFQAAFKACLGASPSAWRNRPEA